MLDSLRDGVDVLSHVTSSHIDQDPHLFVRRFAHPHAFLHRCQSFGVDRNDVTPKESELPVQSSLVTILYLYALVVDGSYLGSPLVRCTLSLETSPHGSSYRYRGGCHLRSLVRAHLGTEGNRLQVHSTPTRSPAHPNPRKPPRLYSQRVLGDIRQLGQTIWFVVSFVRLRFAYLLTTVFRRRRLSCPYPWEKLDLPQQS